MEGFKLVTRWFGQQMEMILTRKMRRFDKEFNEDLLQEVTNKADELHIAYQTGMRVKETAFELGIAAMAVAFNNEKGFGERPAGAEIQLPPTVSIDTPKLDPKELAPAELPMKLPPRKRGPRKK